MLSENIQYFRKSTEISQQELAEKIFVSQQAVDKWEKGIAYPQSDKIPNIATVLNTTPTDLLCDGSLSKEMLYINYTKQWNALTKTLRETAQMHPCRKNILMLELAETELAKNNGIMSQHILLTESEMTLYKSWKNEHKNADNTIFWQFVDPADYNRTVLGKAIEYTAKLIIIFDDYRKRHQNG